MHYQPTQPFRSTQDFLSVVAWANTVLYTGPIFPAFSEGQQPSEELVDETPLDLFILAGQSNMAGRGGVLHTKAGLKWDGVLPASCEPSPGKVTPLEVVW